MAEYPHALTDNLLADAATTSFTDGSGNGLTQDTIYRLTHLTDLSRQSQWWGVTGQSEQRVIWAFSANQTIDCFVLDRGFTLTGTVVVYFDYSANGTDYTNATSISSPDTDVIYWKTFTSQAKTYWRLRITGLTAQPKIPNVWAGLRTQFDFAPMGDFDPYAKKVTGDMAQGMSGNQTFTRRFVQRTIRAGFENITDSQYSASITPIIEFSEQSGRDLKTLPIVNIPPRSRRLLIMRLIRERTGGG